MRKKQIFVILIVFAFLNVASVSLILTVTASPSSSINFGPEPIDLSPEMLGEKEIAIRKYAATYGHGPETGVSPIGEPAELGEEFTFTVSDDGLGVSYDEIFIVVEEGTDGLILITKDAFDSFDGTNYYFANPYGDDSEPWLRTQDLITPDQLAYLMDEFDSNIYPTVTGVFGDPLPRGEEGTKIWTLLFNIRDDAYYNPDAESYIAGYFSASESAQNNKNIMHIDTYDWINRVGPDAARPYLYEGVFAHEFQHLVHYDHDPDEPSWVDEGCADLAGYLCGYGHWDGHIMYYLAYHMFTSLTFWGNQLEDYGQKYLFALYLYEKFGGELFFSTLVDEQANGIEGIENTLRALGYRETFDQIFDRWSIALYLDDTRIWWGKYGFETLEIGSADTRYWTIDYALDYWEAYFDYYYGLYLPAIYEAPFEIDLYHALFGDPLPYTPQYFQFTNEKMSTITMEGSEWSGVLPNSGSNEWYSGADAWCWRSFSQTFDIPSTGATLNFYTHYDIEDYWDFGYVEVLDMDTGEWYTLEDLNGNTMSLDPYGQDNPNVPDGREPSDYLAAGRWHAFTGHSNGYIPIQMDLTPFAGHSIELHFRLWQDGAFTYQNMFVDDISIPEIGFSDDVEAGEGDWITDGWYICDGKFYNNFAVTLLTIKRKGLDENENYIKKLGWVRHMWMNSGTETGVMFMFPTFTACDWLRVAIVSNRADHILGASYSLKVDNWEPWKWCRHCCG